MPLEELAPKAKCGIGCKILQLVESLIELFVFVLDKWVYLLSSVLLVLFNHLLFNSYSPSEDEESLLHRGFAQFRPHQLEDSFEFVLNPVTLHKGALKEQIYALGIEFDIPLYKEREDIIPHELLIFIKLR